MTGPGALDPARAKTRSARATEQRALTGGWKQDSCGVSVRDGCLPLLVVIGPATDGADTVGYHRKEYLKPLIRAHFGTLAIIQ